MGASKETTLLLGFTWSGYKGQSGYCGKAIFIYSLLLSISVPLYYTVSVERGDSFTFVSERVELPFVLYNRDIYS